MWIYGKRPASVIHPVFPLADAEWEDATSK